MNVLWRSACAHSVRLVLCLVAVSIGSVAQSEFSSVHVTPRADISPASARNAMVRSDVDVVLVNVTVLDRAQRPVIGLRPEDFSLIEDRSQQSIKYFSREDQPLALAIVLDCSASMAPRIEQARAAVQELARLSNPQDEISVIVVGDKPALALRSEDLIDTLLPRLQMLPPDGQTALWDSMFVAVEQLKNSHQQRRAMVVISDGGDNHSVYTESELKSLLEEADVEVYAVGLFDRFPRRNEERRGPRDLEELTSVSGGRLLAVHDYVELSRAVSQIDEELRTQYVLGYSSSNRAHDGRWRKLKVSVSRDQDRGKLRAFAKNGYYAATD